MARQIARMPLCKVPKEILTCPLMPFGNSVHYEHTVVLEHPYSSICRVSRCYTCDRQGQDRASRVAIIPSPPTQLRRFPAPAPSSSSLTLPAARQVGRRAGGFMTYDALLAR